MTLSPDNLALLARSQARAQGLLDADPDLRRSLPSLELFHRVVAQRTSIEIVQAAMTTYAERPAVGERAGETFTTLTYRALWQRVVHLAGGLVHAGVVRPGDIAVLVGSSTVDHLVAELACHYLAVTSVPLARNASAQELAHVLGETGSTTVFCTIEERARVTARTVIGMDGPGELAELEALGARAPIVAPVIPAPGQDPLLTIVYTSGSTGTPKGAMFHERSWHARWSTLPFLELASLPMISVVFLPQHHMGGRNAVANSLKLGGLACFTQRSDMSTLFDDIRRVRPTYIHLVPRLSELIYQHHQRGERVDDFLGDRMLLAVTASAPTAPEVAALIKQQFAIPMVNVFAGTEYGQIFVDGRVNRKNVLAHKLVSVPELGYLETDLPYPRGELHVKTARAVDGYLHNPEATRGLFDADGFLRTGDIFEQRGPDEMVWIDRKNNVLKLAQGEFVNLWKLEALFVAGSRHIRQMFLHGDSARSYLLAVIVPDGEVDRATLRAELVRLADAHGLAPYEIPRDFVVEPVPFDRDNALLTGLGKPARPNLKAKYAPAFEQLHARLAAQAAQLADDLPLPAAIAAILGLAEVEPAQSFRSYGGDSIAAANLCAFVQRTRGVTLAVGFVLAASVADICRVVSARPADACAAIHGDGPIRARDLRLARFFPPGAISGGAAGDVSAARHVLLTGATGFLGRFLCLALLERAAQRGGTVTCLVRAPSQAEAAHRISEAYGPGSPVHARFTALRGPLRVIAGGLDALGRQRALAEDIDTVMHAAAHVSHALPYEQLFEPNVVGTAEALRFAMTGRPKRFNFVSTNSVSLALLGDRAQAREDDDTRALGDGWARTGDHANGYRISKWAGEVLAQDAAERHGVPVNVFRCNLILPPARWRGQVNGDDFLTRLVRSVVATGCYPASFYDEPGQAHLDGLPADTIASAIADIGTSASPGYAVYHVNNTHWDDGVSLDTLMRRLVAAGHPLACVADHAAWFAHFERALEALDPPRRSRSSHAIAAQWRAPLAMTRRRRIDASRFTARVPEIAPLATDYLDRCLEDMLR